MRTIKFRGRDFAGAWWYGYPSLYEDNPVIHPLQCVGASMLVDEDTIGQYTGLTDKNGREIYEGDFINYDGSTWGGVVQWHHNGYFFINDSYGKKYPNCVRYRALGDMLDGRPLVVVGNIHDNPELIKKEGNDESDVH